MSKNGPDRRIYLSGEMDLLNSWSGRHSFLLLPADQKALENYNEVHWLLHETDCCFTRGPCIGSPMILLADQKLLLLSLGLPRDDIPKSFPRGVLLLIASCHFGEHAHDAPYESELAEQFEENGASIVFPGNLAKRALPFSLLQDMGNGAGLSGTLSPSASNMFSSNRIDKYWKREHGLAFSREIT